MWTRLIDISWKPNLGLAVHLCGDVPHLHTHRVRDRPAAGVGVRDGLDEWHVHAGGVPNRRYPRSVLVIPRPTVRRICLPGIDSELCVSIEACSHGRLLEPGY